MLRCIVSKTTVREMKGTSAKSGRPYHMRFQEAYIFPVDEAGNADLYPEKFELRLKDEQPAYAVGEYVLHPSSIQKDREGNLSVVPRLAPAPKPVAARAPA